jgi:hypothetical protein
LEKKFMGSNRKYTLRRQQALDAYAKAEREAFAECQASPRPWDFKSPAVLAYFETEKSAWEACSHILNEHEEGQQ